MNIVICGAGDVGRHATEVLGSLGHDVTVIDLEAETLTGIGQIVDVRTLRGNGVQADLLREAGVEGADLFLAATRTDEINLLAASVAKAVGARRCVARVHHSAYFELRGLDYAGHLGIDHLVCPEHSTAVAIAQTLRNPGAMAVERFARGQIEMQQFPVGPRAKVIGKALHQFMPRAARVAAIERRSAAFIPDGRTVIQSGDIVTLVGDVKIFNRVRKLFQSDGTGHLRVVIVGATAMGVWLCRALRSRSFAIKMFVTRQSRAEELADKLHWVTVLNADATDPILFEEEHLNQVDAFVALTADDEHNIIAAAHAKSRGAKTAIAVLQRVTYLHLLGHVGIDRAFSPVTTAIAHLQQWLDERSVRHLASLAVGIADVYEVKVPDRASITGTLLRDMVLAKPMIITAIERGQQVFVPGAEDCIRQGDRLVVAGPSGLEDELRKMFGIKE